MSQTQSVSGQCLCGKIKIKARTASNHVHACHCSTCRRWSGGPLLAVDCELDVIFEGENYIKVFDSSEWAERGFCSECGTHLFYRLKPTGQHIMAADLFDDLNDIQFDGQIFTDQKPDYYDFANKTTMKTGEELFAEFAQSQQDS